MSQNLNVVIQEGNLTNDPEFKTVSQLDICTFNIAINGYKKEDVSFFEIKTFKKIAQNCHDFLKKGSNVKVIGKLKQERWKAPDGSNRSKIVIEANQVIFGYSKKENGSQPSQEQTQESYNDPYDDSIF